MLPGLTLFLLETSHFCHSLFGCVLYIVSSNSAGEKRVYLPQHPFIYSRTVAFAYVMGLHLETTTIGGQPQRLGIGPGTRRRGRGLRNFAG